MEPSSASDAELVAACRLRPWERWLERGFCLAGAVAVLLALENAFRRLLDQGGDWLALVICGPILAALGAWAGWAAGRRLSVRRSAEARVELLRRLGDLPLADHAALARERLAADAYAILFAGRALPQGGRVLVRLIVGPREGTLFAVTHPFFSLDAGDLDPGRVRRLERVLEPAELDSVRALLAAGDEEGFGPAEAPVVDGFPAELAVVGPDRAAEPVCVATNLVHAGGPEDETPTALLQYRLLELAGIAGPEAPSAAAPGEDDDEAA